MKETPEDENQWESDPQFRAPPIPLKPADWSESERWIWQQARKGRIADFHERHGRIDPHEPKGWTEERSIRAAFVETILLHEPFRGALPRQGLRISGVWVRESVDLQNAELQHEWWLNASRVEKDVNLVNLRSKSSISFEASVFTGLILAGEARLDRLLVMSGSEFVALDLANTNVRESLMLSGAKCAGALDMNGLNVGEDLFMDEGAEFGEVELTGASVGAQVNLAGARVTDKLNMNALNVGKSLFMCEGAEFAEVELTAASVRHQLSLDGSKCAGRCNMNGLKVGEALFMRDGAEFAEVDLIGANVNGRLSLAGAKCAGKVSMNGLNVGGSLLMGEGAEFTEIELVSASVGGQIDLTGAKCIGKCNLNGLNAAQSLIMGQGSEFAEVELRAASVRDNLELQGITCTKLNMDGLSVGDSLMGQGAELADATLMAASVHGWLNLDGTKCKGELKMNGLNVGRSLFMGGSSELGEVILTSASVGGDIHLDGAKCAGTLDMERLKVGSDLFMRRMQCESEIDLRFASIGGSVRLSGSILKVIDLTGVSVKGFLEFGTYGDMPIWREGSKLVMNGASIGSIAGTFDASAWPGELDLGDLTYARFAGLRENTEQNVKWLIDDWLTRDREFSRQPYQQLARVLQDLGYSSNANDVLYAGQERARVETAAARRWVGLTFLKYTIGYGYGYRYFYSLIWVVLFAALGAGVFSTVQTHLETYSLAQRIVIGLSQLLPIINLDNELLKQALRELPADSWQLYTFYALKIAGYVLGGFVVAGLSGITKK